MTEVAKKRVTMMVSARFWKLCFFFLLILWLTPFIAEARPPTEITGVVQDGRTHQGLPGVEVTLDGPETYTTKTGPEGTFRLTVLPGAYEASLTRPGYEPIYEEVFARLGQVTQVTWSLRRPATVDLGWYLGSNSDVSSLPGEVNTVIQYADPWACPQFYPAEPWNFDIQRNLQTIPEGIGVWVQIPDFFHIVSYVACRQGDINLFPPGLYSYINETDPFCGLSFIPYVTGDRATCEARYLAPIEQTINRIRSFTGAHKIRGWYVIDEPELQGGATSARVWNPAIVREYIDFVRRVDLDGGPVISLSSFLPLADPAAWGNLTDWLSLTDFFGIDFYPKHNASSIDFEPPGGLNPWEQGWRWVEIYNQLLAPYGPTSYTIAQGQGPTSGFGYTAPSLEEARYSAWNALLHGIQGVLFWWYPNSDVDRHPTDGLIRNSVHQVFREIREHRIPQILFEGLESNAYQYTPQDEGLTVAFRKYEDRWYLLVANRIDQHQAVEFTLNIQPPAETCQTPVSIVTELIETRPIPFEQLNCQGPVVFRDFLPRGAVRAYRLFDPPRESGGLQNPQFEERLRGWERYGDGGARTLTQGAFSGTYSAQIKRDRASGNYFGLVQRKIAVEPNTEYRLSLWVRTNTTNGSAAAALGVWSSDPSHNHHTDFGWISGAREWVQISGTWRSRPDESMIQVVLYGSPDFVGEAYFDGLILEKTNPQNGGFEDGLRNWERYGDGTSYETANGGIEGSHAAHLQREGATGQYFGLVQRIIPCEPNTIYQLSLWLKTNAGSGAAAAGLGNWSGDPGQNTHRDFGWTGGSTDWTQISGTWTSGENERTLDVVLYATPDFSGEAYFDNVALEKVGLAPLK